MDFQPGPVLPDRPILGGNKPLELTELLGLTPESIALCMVLFGYTQYSVRQTYFGQFVDFRQHEGHCSEIQAWAVLSLGGPRISGMAELPSSTSNIPPTLSLLNFLLTGSQSLVSFHSTQQCFPVLYITWMSNLQLAFCLEEPHFAFYSIQLQLLCCVQGTVSLKWASQGMNSSLCPS